MKYSKDELRMIGEVLPSIAKQLRANMATVYIAATKLTPTSAREQDEKVDKYAAALSQSYFRMCRLVNNMSDAHLLAGSGRFALLSNGDVVDTVRKVYEQAEPLFEGEGVTLEFSSNKPRCIIRMDGDLIRKMMLNLLSNALKYTPRGGRAEVRVRVTEHSVFISVSDTGRGIAPEELERVFDRFLDVDPLAPPPKGIGLGLALCRRIAEGHGGAIVAESEEGKGARFTVSLLNERSTTVTMRQSTAPTGSGFDPTMVALSDALGLDAFSYRYLD
ncbi:MAG: HAMP domain-containing histidine kinase [Oscillospiraceae bacterium]|nr:HAMP domain-containing histidine kinase [Oscillospiraceae bacterium]